MFKYILIVISLLYSFNVAAESKCEFSVDNHEICINVIDVSFNCEKDYKGYFDECTVTVSYDVTTTWDIDADEEEYLDISSECNSVIEFTSAFSSVYNGTKDGFTYETMEYSPSSSSNRFTEDMYFQFTMSNMNINSVKVKTLDCHIANVLKI